MPIKIDKNELEKAKLLISTKCRQKIDLQVAGVIFASCPFSLQHPGLTSSTLATDLIKVAKLAN